MEPSQILKGNMFLAESLNRYPRDFATFDYAYKQINPHWYLEIH